jgi:hypothetical protein
MTPMTRLIVALLCVLLSAPAPAKEKRERDQGEPLRESVRKVERETGGEVLRAERVPQAGRSVNRIKVITPEGRVRVYREDARNNRREEPAPRSDRDDRDDRRHD